MEETQEKNTVQTRDQIIAELEAEYPDVYKMLDYNEFDISEKLSKNTLLYMKFRDLAAAEKYQLHVIEAFYEQAKGEQYDYYRFNVDQKLSPKEIETYYLPKDKKLVKIKMLMANQSVRVEFFDALAKGFDKQAWSMKNFLDSMKMS